MEGLLEEQLRHQLSTEKLLGFGNFCILDDTATWGVGVSLVKPNRCLPAKPETLPEVLTAYILQVAMMLRKKDALSLKQSSESTGNKTKSE